MAVSIKGILWGLLFCVSAFILFTIPTILIVTYWIDLNQLVDLQGKPIYTYAMFAVFCFIVVIIIGFIMVAAMFRAFVQCKNPEEDVPSFGIPRAVKGFAIVTTAIIGVIMILWYVFVGEIAFYVLVFPK